MDPLGSHSTKPRRSKERMESNGRRPWTLRELLHAEPELIAPLTKDA